MKQKIWIAFYDTNHGNREEWTTDYTQFVIATTKEMVIELAEKAIQEHIDEYNFENEVDRQAVRENWDIDVRETELNGKFSFSEPCGSR